MRLSWPMVLMEALYTVGQIVDMIRVGKIGPSAIAGVGIANIYFLVLMSMDVGLIMGVRAMVVRHVGAGEIRRASNISRAGMLGALWGVIVGIIGLIVVEPVFRLSQRPAIHRGKWRWLFPQEVSNYCAYLM